MHYLDIRIYTIVYQPDGLLNVLFVLVEISYYMNTWWSYSKIAMKFIKSAIQSGCWHIVIFGGGIFDFEGSFREVSGNLLSQTWLITPWRNCTGVYTVAILVFAMSLLRIFPNGSTVVFGAHRHPTLDTRSPELPPPTGILRTQASQGAHSKHWSIARMSISFHNITNVWGNNPPTAAWILELRVL